MKAERGTAGNPTVRTDPVIALVLSGGGLKGVAHIGAWRALREAGIRPGYVVGTSIGAFIGGAIAGGLEVERLERFGRTVTRRDIAVLDRRALVMGGVKRPAAFRNDALRAYLERVLPWHSFYQLPTPLNVGAVDLTRGQLTWFGVGPGRMRSSRGDVSLVDAILASSALPTFYPPVRIGDTYYVDGGVLDTFPIRRAAELGADWIIGVDVTTGGGEREADFFVDQGMLGVSTRVFGLMASQRRKELIETWNGPRLTVVRPRVEGVDTFSFDRNDYLIDEGYRAAADALRAEGVWAADEDRAAS